MNSPRLLTTFVAFLFTALLAAPLAAEDAPSLAKLLRNLATAREVAVPDGTYTTAGGRTIEGLRGSAEKPIILRAEHRGKVTITGEAGLVLRGCEHVVIEGFVFQNDADQQCVQLIDCRSVRITRNVFRPIERAQPRHWEHWVTVDGAKSSGNRIDHNLFEKKVNRGSPLFIRGDDEALVCSQRDRIDRNHFRDVIYANRENGHETIRTGGNDLGASGRSSFTIIEENLLERCSGEDEIMSLKSSDNIVRRNTLIDCRGAICFRLGNRSVAEGNIIIVKEGGPSCGGIKLFGFEHRVEGNYFAGLTGRKHEAPFSFFPGMHDTPTTENLRERYDNNTASAATRCVVTGNTWVDCAPLQIGLETPDPKWTYLPTRCTFTGNRLLRTTARPEPLVNFGLMRDLTAKDNVAFEPSATGSEPWTGWFQWEKKAPAFTPPTPLTPSDVGPDAP